MAGYRVDFRNVEWQKPRRGARFKLAKTDQTQMRILEFTPKLSHPEWCLVGHTGLVLEGRLELRFENETLIFEAGDGLVVPPGEAHKHIPRALTDKVRLVVIDQHE